MTFGTELASRNFGGLLLAEAVERWCWREKVPFHLLDLGNPEAVRLSSRHELLILGPGSLLFATWVPAFQHLDEQLNGRAVAWYSGLVPEFAQGPEERDFLRRLLDRSVTVVVRWPQEQEWLTEVAGYDQAVVGSDPAFLFSPACSLSDQRDNGTVLFAINGYGLEEECKRRQMQELRRLARWLEAQAVRVDFLIAHPMDLEAAREIAQTDSPQHFDDLRAQRAKFAGAALIIGERLQPLLYAATQRIPFLALNYHPKIAHLASALEMKDCLIETQSAPAGFEELQERVEGVFANSSAIAQKLAAAHEKQAAVAWAALAYLKKVERGAISSPIAGLPGPAGAGGACGANAKAARRVGRPTIAHCLAVRNEERLLPELLRLTRPYVDEILVYDDCSTDGTAAIAARYADRVFIAHRPAHFCEGYFEPLMGLTRCDWILVISPDTRPEPALLRSLRDLTAEDNINGYFFDIRTQGRFGGLEEDDPKIRLMRRGATRWPPCPHAGPEVAGRTEPTDLILYHLRDHEEDLERIMVTKWTRNLHVLRKEMRSVWRKMGEFEKSHYQKCLEEFHRFYPDRDERSKVILYTEGGSSAKTLHCLGDLGRRLEGRPWTVEVVGSESEEAAREAFIDADLIVLADALPASEVWQLIQSLSHRLFVPIACLDCECPADLRETLDTLNRHSLWDSDLACMTGLIPWGNPS